jgi:hypothetical protein
VLGLLSFADTEKHSANVTMKSLKPNVLNRSHDALSFRTFVVVLAFLTGGCAHESRHESPAAVVGQEFLPRPPVFLTGPAVMLLTNAGGFTARVVVSSVPASSLRPVSGQLVARGSKFFFEPELKSGKPARAVQFSFIWDATSNKGYMLSEALQGYAPIASTVWFTNLVVQSSPTTTGKVEGYRVECSTDVVAASDGKLSRFEVSRARDLGGLAVRVNSIEDPAPFTITLSQIRLELPPEKVFLPPDGFTGYESEEAMMNELVSRQQSVRHGGQEGSGAGGHDGSGRNRHSRAGPENGNPPAP